MTSFHHSSPQQLHCITTPIYLCFIETHYLHTCTLHILFGDMDLWITSTTWWGLTCMGACSLNDMFAGACTFWANQDVFAEPTLMSRSSRGSSSSSKSSSWCPLKRFEIKWGIALYERILNTHGWQERNSVQSVLIALPGETPLAHNKYHTRQLLRTRRCAVTNGLLLEKSNKIYRSLLVIIGH